MDSSAARRRITDFERRFTRAQATEVVELGWGYALLQQDYPASWHHNRVVVTGAVTPAEVITTADRVLGDHGHAHRLVHYLDDTQGAAAAEAFVQARYGMQERVVTMIHSAELPDRGHGLVEVLTFADLRPTLVQDWRTSLPDATADSIEQLADRVQLSTLGAELTLLGVRDESGDVVARGELYVADGVAQFESIVTRTASRGRGYAKALVAEALHRARDAGCDLQFLVADAADWPHAWYQRLGYQDADHSRIYQRLP